MSSKHGRTGDLHMWYSSCRRVRTKDVERDRGALCIYQLQSNIHSVLRNGVQLPEVLVEQDRPPRGKLRHLLCHALRCLCFQQGELIDEKNYYFLFKPHNKTLPSLGVMKVRIKISLSNSLNYFSVSGDSKQKKIPPKSGS